jgi:DNA-binding transcriptional LysR family regulator
MLDLHRLRVFRSVVASGSVQAAAANLGYTPSAVSQHITALQKEVGLTLLERAGRGLRPTAAGFALAAEADGVLARIGEAETLVSDLRTGRTGRLSIAYFASVGSVWLPSVVHRLSEEFPGVRLDLRLSDNAPDRPDDRADIHLIVARHDFVTGRGFTTHHLLDDPYIVALPETHPLAASGTVELSDLKHERWIDNDFAAGWCRQNLLDSCAAVPAGVPRRDPRLSRRAGVRRGRHRDHRAADARGDGSAGRRGPAPPGEPHPGALDPRGGARRGRDHPARACGIGAPPRRSRPRRPRNRPGRLSAAQSPEETRQHRGRPCR